MLQRSVRGRRHRRRGWTGGSGQQHHNERHRGRWRRGRRRCGRGAPFHAVHEIGREVPRAISIISFDDIPEAAYFTPPLTTVNQDFSALGRRCLHLLLEQIESGRRSWSRVMVEAELVLRKSAAAVAGPDELVPADLVGELTRAPRPAAAAHP
ncbi:substrate-binding domain-containing protein [Sorangium sp. So ce233]|uniref:substrate-binding domain-containing protein n=1 Tax=Sorangium sp. So ce233 TaxID=3133290 RepID=UPI003F5DACD1